MTEKPPTYPPFSKSEPSLAERVADLEAQIRESGDAAAIAELKRQLVNQSSRCDLAEKIADRKGALLHEAACALDKHGIPAGRLSQRCEGLATRAKEAERDRGELRRQLSFEHTVRMDAQKTLNECHERYQAQQSQAERDRDEALKANADACELLSHHVEPPFGDLPAMVSALLKQRRPDLRGYLEMRLGFAPAEVIVTGPSPKRLDLPPQIGGFNVGEAVRSWGRGEAATARVQLLSSKAPPPHKRGSEPWMNEGFTPPHTPAKVSPATFGPAQAYSLLGEILDAHPNRVRRSVLAFPFAPTVKQLGGPPLSYATDGSSGLDLPVSESAQLGAGAGRLFSTGITLEIPPGYEGQIRPRSSCPKTLEVRLGTIDSDYRGEIKVMVLSKRAPHDTGCDTITPDKAIAQLVIAPVAKAQIERVASKADLSETSRGAGGFGSTSKEQRANLFINTPWDDLGAMITADEADIATRDRWQRWLDEATAEIEAEEVRAAFDPSARVTRVQVTLETEGTLKDVSIPVVVAKHPIQAAAEQVTATTEELLTARAKAAEATRAYQAAVDEQEEKSKGMTAAARAINEWSARTTDERGGGPPPCSAEEQRRFAQAIEIGNAALDGIGLTSYRCEISGDPPRLSLVRVPFVGFVADISDE